MDFLLGLIGFFVRLGPKLSQCNETDQTGQTRWNHRTGVVLTSSSLYFSEPKCPVRSQREHHFTFNKFSTSDNVLRLWKSVGADISITGGVSGQDLGFQSCWAYFSIFIFLFSIPVCTCTKRVSCGSIIVQFTYLGDIHVFMSGLGVLTVGFFCCSRGLWTSHCEASRLPATHYWVPTS